MKIKHYIISYDIGNKKRLAKVGRLFKTEALRVQNSVYYWQGSQTELNAFQDALNNIINSDEDDIRGYLISPSQLVHLFGAPLMQEGCFLTTKLRYQHHPISTRSLWHKVMG